MSKVRYNKLKTAAPIPNNEWVKVTQMNHIVEVVYVEHESDVLEFYPKVDKEHYLVVDRETGEVVEEREYKLNENRAQNTEGLKKTMKNIRDLINNNFIGANNELFITLTYRFIDDKPMIDLKKAAKDFDRFIKRFRRRYPDLEYIAILEPQANTAWHWHILVKFTNWHEKSHIRIDNNEIIEPLWGHGFTNTKALRDVDNIGAYLSAYLASVEINDENKEDFFETVYKNAQDIVIEEKEIADENGKKMTKKFIKGGRMYLYPSGANLYRYSRGIEKPMSQTMTYRKAKKLIGWVKPEFSRTITITDEEYKDRIFNTVTYEHYNIKRKSKNSNRFMHLDSELQIPCYIVEMFGLQKDESGDSTRDSK